MGLFDSLKSIAGKAISDAVSDGVKKVVGGTVTKAANEAVDVAASKAQKAINTEIENTAAKYKEPAGTTVESSTQAAPAQNAAAGQAVNSLFGNLGSALNGLANVDFNALGQAMGKLEGAAGEMIKGMAVCPKCGFQNEVTANVCIKCGTKLPVAELSQEERQEALKGGIGQVVSSGAPAAAANPLAAGSWGETMPSEPNQYNYNGTWKQYFENIFLTEFASYRKTHEKGYGKTTDVYRLYKGDDQVLVVELCPSKFDGKSLRTKCRGLGIPYLRFYYDYEGWWNTRAYVVDRMQKAIKK